MAKSSSKTILSHGMNSEKASKVKLKGHKAEDLFAELINGEVIKGQGKIDIIDKHGKKYSVKGGSDIEKGGGDGRWQLFLFGLSKFENDLNFPARDYFIKILKSFPQTRALYDKQVDKVKEKVARLMLELKDYLSSEKNTKLFFDKTIFDFQIDFLCVFHDKYFHIFSRQDLLNSLITSCTIHNSRGNQKVKYNFDGRIAIEIEIRKTDDGKFPSILVITNKLKILKILSQNIKDQVIVKDKIKVYGEAIKKFKI